MTLSTRKKPRLNRKAIVLVITAALIVVGALISVWLLFINKPTPRQQTKSPINTTNLDPPTPEEQQEAEQNKSEVTKDQQKETSQTTPTQPGQKIDAKPFIVYAGQNDSEIELNSYTSAVFEDGGTCTATFTKGTQTVMRSVIGFADARHTTCPPIAIPRGDFAQAGDWKVKLTYNSRTATGTSTEVTVTIR